MVSGRERDTQRTRVAITERTVYHHSKTAGLGHQDVYCPDCGFPKGGNEKQQYAFIVAKRKIRSEIKDEENMLGYGKYMLWIAALFNGFSYRSQNGFVLVAGLLVSTTFVVLSFWVRRNPFATFLTALIVYVSLELFLTLFDPMFIVRDLVLKIMVAGAFSYAMHAAKRIERLKRELWVLL